MKDAHKNIFNKSIHAHSCIIATEPLNQELVNKILPKNITVTDTNFITNYFHLSGDNRLLFGGKYKYNEKISPQQQASLKRKMVEVFPELKINEIDYCWNEPINTTINGLPNVGKISSNIFYAHGYSCHSMILSDMLGKIIAEAVSGTVEKFDIFAKVKHMPLIGGDITKRTIFSLGNLWLQLRDLL